VIIWILFVLEQIRRPGAFTTGTADHPGFVLPGSRELLMD
jgi:hypothetical protein